jgi:hypothetical protein
MEYFAHFLQDCYEGFNTALTGTVPIDAGKTFAKEHLFMGVYEIVL